MRSKQECRGRGGGGQVVSILVFYSDNPSSNPGEGYSFSEKIVFKKTNINKKRPMLVDFLKKLQIILILIQ